MLKSFKHFSPSERSALRLAAGCAMLKICETKDVGDVYTLEQFYNLAQLAVDPCKQVCITSNTKSSSLFYPNGYKMIWDVKLNPGVRWKCRHLIFQYIIKKLHI